MIKKIIDSIADDKKDHVLLGMFVGYPLMIIGYILDTSLQMDFMVISGAIVGIVLVAAKEIVHDGWLARGNVEFLDFIYSAIPIVFALLCYVV